MNFDDLRESIFDIGYNSSLDRELTGKFYCWATDEHSPLSEIRRVIKYGRVGRYD